MHFLYAINKLNANGGKGLYKIYKRSDQPKIEIE